MTEFNTEYFIERANKLYNNKYSYDKTSYVKSNLKVIITCQTHGDFLQTPHDHLSGSGCKQCGIKIRAKKRTNNISYFINKAKEIHGDKYSYDKTIYKFAKEKVIITCPTHGDFLQTPNKHLYGRGCKKCANDMNYVRLAKTTEYFIEKSRSVHGDKYDYSKSVYTGTDNKIKIICKIHGEFYQTAYRHSSGGGCKFCAYDRISIAATENAYGWSKTKWAELCDGDGMLYIIKMYNDNEEFIKIGITGKTLNGRFKYINSDDYKYSKIITITGEPEFIWEEEKRLHKMFKKYKYKPKIDFNGKTECFSIEILPELKKSFRTIKKITIFTQKKYEKNI